MIFLPHYLFEPLNEECRGDFTGSVIGPLAQLVHLLTVHLQMDIQLLDHCHWKTYELWGGGEGGDYNLLYT